MPRTLIAPLGKKKRLKNFRSKKLPRGKAGPPSRSKGPYSGPYCLRNVYGKLRRARVGGVFDLRKRLQFVRDTTDKQCACNRSRPYASPSGGNACGYACRRAHHSTSIR